MTYIHTNKDVMNTMFSHLTLRELLNTRLVNRLFYSYSIHTLRKRFSMKRVINLYVSKENEFISTLVKCKGIISGSHVTEVMLGEDYGNHDLDIFLSSDGNVELLIEFLEQEGYDGTNAREKLEFFSKARDRFNTPNLPESDYGPALQIYSLKKENREIQIILSDQMHDLDINERISNTSIQINAVWLIQQFYLTCIMNYWSPISLTIHSKFPRHVFKKTCALTETTWINRDIGHNKINKALEEDKYSFLSFASKLEEGIVKGTWSYDEYSGLSEFVPQKLAELKGLKKYVKRGFTFIGCLSSSDNEKWTMLPFYRIPCGYDEPNDLMYQRMFCAPRLPYDLAYKIQCTNSKLSLKPIF
jgi:hypothetical protein